MNEKNSNVKTDNTKMKAKSYQIDSLNIVNRFQFRLAYFGLL